jgi:hypothetical protein
MAPFTKRRAVQRFLVTPLDSDPHPNLGPIAMTLHARQRAEVPSDNGCCCFRPIWQRSLGTGLQHCNTQSRSEQISVCHKGQVALIVTLGASGNFCWTR